jgi:hypothetical protein
LSEQSYRKTEKKRPRQLQQSNVKGVEGEDRSVLRVRNFEPRVPVLLAVLCFGALNSLALAFVTSQHPTELDRASHHRSIGGVDAPQRSAPQQTIFSFVVTAQE